MNGILEKSSISAKIMALLLMLGAITLFIAWNGARTLMQADAEYSDIMNDSLNGTVLARAGRDALSMRFAAYQAMAYHSGTPEAQAGLDGEGKSFQAASNGLATAKKQQSELRTQIEKFESTLRTLHQLTRAAAQYGAVDRNAEAMVLLTKADKIGAAFTNDIKALNDSTFAVSNKRNDEQTVIDTSSSTTMLVMAVIGIVGGTGLAYVVSRSGITGPLKRLEDQMGEIARGDYRNDVIGADRGDEVGTMAKAVRVFRENGIAKQAADAAAARADAEQKMVVETVSSHLGDLSGGDLTATIQAEFPGGYATLKANFNEALDKLRDLIGAVSEGTATIRTGAGEIAQASEDLARRTESNAASLEETAAAVTQIDGRLKASAQAAAQTVARAD